MARTFVHVIFGDIGDVIFRLLEEHTMIVSRSLLVILRVHQHWQRKCLPSCVRKVFVSHSSAWEPMLRYWSLAELAFDCALDSVRWRSSVVWRPRRPTSTKEHWSKSIVTMSINWLWIDLSMSHPRLHKSNESNLVLRAFDSRNRVSSSNRALRPIRDTAKQKKRSGWTRRKMSTNKQASYVNVIADAMSWDEIGIWMEPTRIIVDIGHFWGTKNHRDREKLSEKKQERNCSQQVNLRERLTL